MIEVYTCERNIDFAFLLINGAWIVDGGIPSSPHFLVWFSCFIGWVRSCDLDSRCMVGPWSTNAFRQRESFALGPTQQSHWFIIFEGLIIFNYVSVLSPICNQYQARSAIADDWSLFPCAISLHFQPFPAITKGPNAQHISSCMGSVCFGCIRTYMIDEDGSWWIYLG